MRMKSTITSIQLKNQNILDVNNEEYDYQMGVYYMDIIAE